jgi:hypothetical protein
MSAVLFACKMSFAQCEKKVVWTMDSYKEE